MLKRDKHKMRSIYILFTFASILIGTKCENVTETEMFSITITPKMFNWTYAEYNTQYSFHASLINKPDLPSWLHYIYSIRQQAGFIYGTPPISQKDIVLQVIGLNKENYETRETMIPIYVQKKSRAAKYQVQLKIDNLNVEDLLNEYRMEKLKDIFRKKLWRESTNDLYTTFMVSAIELGARLPLKPDEGEGVVLKLGSFKPHSTELLQLQEEVKPLFKHLPKCPRDFKRTSVERLFREVEFELDWCSFRLIEEPSVEKESKLVLDASILMKEQNRWLPPARYEVPHRSYVHEFVFTIIVPMLVMIFLVSVLSMILCFHHEGINDVESNYFFDTIFHICDEYIENKRTARNQVSDSKVELSHYHSDTSGTTDANPSSSAPNVQNGLGDNYSNKSTLGISPNNSLKKHPSPRSNPSLLVDYNRPQPPPYLGSNTNTLVLRQRQNLDEELATKRSQAKTLEESLQMLNEANIANPNYHMDEAMYRIGLNEDMFLEDNMNVVHPLVEDYLLNKQESGMPLPRHIGFINGGITNGGVRKGYEGF